MRPLLLIGLTCLALGCTGYPGPTTSGLQGEIKADGSSTVFPITEAMVDAFNREHPGIKISIGQSGTGGGFQKFAAAETDLSNASRPIKEKEKDACSRAGIDFVELQVGWDGLAVAIHPDNTWAEKLTLDQLHKIWRPDNPARKWSDVDPSWPAEEIKLFGPGSKSGTFDFFTEKVNGKEQVSRKDYESSENDNVLVRGVAGDKYALGYFGLAYYQENKDKLKVAKVADRGSDQFIAPSTATVVDQSYKPLSRPLFVYARTESLKRPEVQEFLRFYLRRGDLVDRARYVKLDPVDQGRQTEKLDKAIQALK